MAKAVSEFQNGNTSLRAIAKKYAVPKSTLEFKLKNPDHKQTFGPSPVLTNSEEATLVKWIAELARKGFPRKRDDIIASVQNFLIANPRPNPFTNNRPGAGWLKAFFRRHPEITERTSEAVTSASSCVSEKDIRKWFVEVKDYLKEKQLEQVIEDPTRIFNGDETGFQICPETGKVLAPKGIKNVYTIDQGSSKENITVMFTFSASGSTCSPMIVYPYKRIPEKISQSVPANWGIGRSDSGWMTAEVFYEYISKVFYPYLIAEGITFPVILFVDGHKSHLTYQLSVLCSNLAIEIIALYPNATRILQPADVAVFRPIKVAWRKAVRNWQSDHPGESLTKLSFAPLLDEVVKSSAKPDILVNGFKACGLYPLNADAIDYSKCLGSSKKNETFDNKITDTTMKYSTFANIVGNEKLEQFKRLDAVLPEGTNNEDFFALFRIWKHFESTKEEPDQIINLSNEKIDNEDLPQNMIVTDVLSEQESGNTKEADGVIASTTDQHITTANVEVPENNEDSPQHMIVTDELPEQNSDINTKETDGAISRTTHQQRTTAVVDVANNVSIAEFLDWPDSPKRKGKRETERLPYAVTCNKYQEMLAEKRAKKKEEEEQKNKKRALKKEADEVRAKKKKEDQELKEIRKHQQNIKKLEKTQKKASNVSRKNKLCAANKITCYVCAKIIKCNELSCDECKQSFHKSCIPASHKQHIPDPTDNDTFLCHICYKEESDSDVDTEKEEEQESEENEIEEERPPAETEEQEDKENEKEEERTLAETEEEEKEIDELYNMYTSAIKHIY
ncbi:eukaryotic translation initiation factor 5B-like [Photinus pyralis]|nr:eukaryotic translation initiation factor 5B-like [Photinus pyralis]